MIQIYNDDCTCIFLELSEYRNIKHLQVNNTPYSTPAVKT